MKYYPVYKTESNHYGVWDGDFTIAKFDSKEDAIRFAENVESTSKSI